MSDPDRRAVLLVQLGTPDAPTYGALRRYLREFLGDPKVVDLPRWLWLPILYGPILTFRPRTSAALYRRVWTPQGSPLLITTEAVRDALRPRLTDVARVEMAMRYGRPSLRETLRSLADDGVEEVLLAPLFPQYSETTTGSVVEAAHEALRGGGPRLRVVDPYFSHPSYVDAVAERAREVVREHGAPDRWVISFHGIPVRYAERGDPYPEHCEATAAAVARALELDREQWIQSYQSRVGPAPWLQPYTDETFAALGREGVGSLYVICPGFAADCLETIDEIGAVGQEQFAAAGGGTLRLVPCVNDSPRWIEALEQVLRESLEA